MRTISDEQFSAWGHGLRRSDREIFAEVFEETYDALLGFARYIVRDPHAAHDVLQEVYTKLWQIRASVDPGRSLKALLYQMVRNYALNHERYRKTRIADSIDDSFAEPGSAGNVEDLMHLNELSGRLRSWVEQMPSRRREAFVLSRYEGLSHDEIARIMNLTPRTVNNHIVLALQDLRARLHDFEAETVK